MDKTIIVDAKSELGGLTAHRLVGTRRGIHEKYGLWICSGNRSQGRDFAHKPAPIKPRYFEFYCISHMFEGNGIYWTPKGGEVNMEPGQCVIVSPNHIHHYGAMDGIYVEDTVCFAGPVADHLFKCGVIANGVFNLGKARRLIPIVEMAIDPAVDSQIDANLALQNLLVDIYRQNRNNVPEEKHSYLKKLMDEIKNTPDKWWTVSEMAEFCNLSEPQFRRVFRGYAGMSPKNYVDRLKIQQAAERVASSDESIAVIAERFGYLDPFHFSRRFKQIQGLSPSEYRAQTIRR